MTANGRAWRADSSRTRGRQIREILAGLDGLPGFERRLHVAPRVDADLRAAGLRQALDSLGPVFRKFGLYLSTRADVFPAAVRRELGTLADTRAPMPPAEVRALFVAEFGRTPEDLDLCFDPVPVVSRLLWQVHRAYDGDRMLRLRVRRALTEELEDDLNSIDAVTRLFHSTGWERPQIEALLADFRQTIREQSDFELQLRALGRPARQSIFDQALVPAPLDRLCSAGILTTLAGGGQSLDTLLLDRAYPTAGRAEAARGICLAWLRVAFDNGYIPFEADAADVAVSASFHLTFPEGALSPIPLESKTNLRAYLMALATDNPDAACSALLREVQPTPAAPRADDLLRRFRQLVPFRDGERGLQGCGAGDRIAIHWRFLSELGVSPRAHLTSFFRGLCGAVELAQALEPGEDALGAALQDLRLLGGMSQFETMANPRHAGDLMEKYIEASAGLPALLNTLMTTLTEGTGRFSITVSTKPDAGKGRSTPVIAGSLLLVGAGAVVLARGVGGSVDQIQTFIFCGALIALWMVTRIR